MSTSQAARSGTLLAIASMTCVQTGLAVSVHLFDDIGPLGAAWLRLAWAGVLMLVLVRPRRSSFTRRSLATTVALGVVTGAITLLFMASVARIPLGTASALEFLGPLGVAVVRSHGRRALLWPLLAGLGVVLLTQPWHGGADPVGVGFALGAAWCWAAYILLTQRVGDDVDGLQGLAVSLAVAAVTASVVAAGSTVPRLTWDVVVAGLGLALLLPMVPFALELLALRRLNAGAFGTLMSLEPSLALLAGLVLLGQRPDAGQVLGIAFVVAAGVGAARSGARSEPAPEAAPARVVSADRS